MQDQLFHLYRSLQVLKAVHGQACRRIVVPAFYGNLMVLMVVSAYTTLRFHHVLPLFLWSAMPVIFVILCILCVLLHQSSGGVFDSSASFIQSQSLHGDPYLRRVVKSLKPLRVYVGNTYFLRKRTFGTFVDSFVNYTVMLLLAFR